MQNIRYKQIIATFALCTLFLHATQQQEQQKQVNPLYLFSHGLANNKTQIQAYIDEKILPPTAITFNYPHGRNTKTVFKKIPVTNRVSLAQQYDIDALAKQYDFWQRHLPQLNRTGIIGFGISNGASTWINFVAQKQPQNLVALVLESPFDHTKSLINGMQQAIKQHLGLSIKSKNIDNFMKGIFRKYDPKGLQTIDLVAQLPKDLPVLLICSKADTRVPAQSTINLYNKLRATGHDNVHLLVLDYAQHDKLISNTKTKSLFTQCVHAFYKHYGLPHDAQLAQDGEQIFSQTQNHYKTLF